MAIKKTLYLEEGKHNTDWTGQSNESNGDMEIDIQLKFMKERNITCQKKIHLIKFTYDRLIALNYLE